jgi:hypothetical protein
MYTQLCTPDPSHRRCNWDPWSTGPHLSAKRGQRSGADRRILPGGEPAGSEVTTRRSPTARRTHRWEKRGLRRALARMAGGAASPKPTDSGHCEVRQGVLKPRGAKAEPSAQS